MVRYINDCLIECTLTVFISAFNTVMKADADEHDLGRVIQYNYEKLRLDISKDWNAPRVSVSSLDKDFLRLTDESILDGQLINVVVKIENNGPILENCLTSVPLRYEGKLEFEQILQSRLIRCKYLVHS